MNNTDMTTKDSYSDQENYEEDVDDEYYYDTEDESYGPLRKRVDFITRLPYEVVNIILLELSTVELFACLEVSPKWLELLQKLPKLWYQVTIDDENYGMVDQLSSIGNHIRKYRIYDGCQEILDGSVSQILGGSMNNLESLAWDCSDFVSDDVLRCVSHLHGTLSELEIVYTFDTRYVLPFAVPSITSILRACPTLKRLQVSLHDSQIRPAPEQHDNSVSDNFKLTHLHWHPGAYIAIEELENILVACPLLLYLSIGSFEGPISTLSFRNQCPSTLRYLHLDVGENNKFGLYSCSNDDGSDDNSHDEDVGHNNGRLIREGEEEREAAIRNNNKSMHSKLESFGTVCYNEVEWRELENVIRIDQKSLQSLIIRHHESFDLAALLDIFQGSFLSFSYSYIYWRSRASINATLSKYIIVDGQQENIERGSYKKQQKLTIHSAFETSIYQQRHLPWFMDGLRGVQTRPSSWKVSKLEFYDCIIDITYIQSLLELSSLEELSITTSKHEALAIEPLTTLINGLCASTRQQQQQQQHEQRAVVPRVRRLCLGPVTGLTDDIVARFTEINELKDLTLRKCDDITDKGVLYLVDCESSLENISILQCKKVSSEAQEYIKQIQEQRRYQQKQ